jgi:hypothetical protein
MAPGGAAPAALLASARTVHQCGAPEGWTFITSQASLLIEVTRTPSAKVRELADRSKLTERQAHRVLGDLATTGYLVRERVGRRNVYRVSEDRPMRHPTVAAHTVGELLAALSP